MMDEFTEGGFNIVNRAAILVTPLEPYIEWAGSVDEDGPEDAKLLKDNINVYLIEEYDNPEDEDRLVEQNFEMMFAGELAAWHSEEDGWPAIRDWNTFQKWFTWRVQPLVFDLVPWEEEYEEEEGSGEFEL